MWWFVAVFIVALVVAYAMAPKPQNAKPIGLEDVTVPTAEEGREICVIFGERVIDGPNLVWYGDMRTMAIRRQKQTIGYDIYLGMHLVLSHGPIDRVLEITADEKQAWKGNWTGGDMFFFAATLFGGQDKEGGIAGTVSLDQGGPTQTVNPYLQAKIGGLVPAYRGVASIVCKQIYVGTTAYLKKMGFRAKRIHVRQSGGLTQWYDAKSEVYTVAPSGELITAVAVSGTATRTDDVSSWTKGVTTIPGSTTLTRGVALGDRYIAWNHTLGTTVMKTLDGVNWTPTGGDYGLTGGGGEGAVFANTLIICRGIQGWSYSIDNGVTFVQSSSPFVSYIAASPLFAIAASPYTSDLKIMTGLTWTSGVTAHGITFSHTSGIAYSDNNSLFYVGGDDGAGTYHPKIISSSTGADIFNETLPSTTNNTSCCGIAAGGTSVVAITSGGQIIYKVGSNPWLLSANTFTLVHPQIRYVNGKFIIVGESATAYVSTDGGLNWTTNTLPTAVNVAFGGLTIDTRDPGVGDMNPAHIIRECLTDPDWGLGYNDSDIDDATFMVAADTLYAEKMGISVLWNTQTEINDFINNIVKHIDGSVYIDKSTGKFVLKLIRFDYDVSTLLTINPSNCQYVSDFAQPTFGKLTNSVTVQFYDSKNNKDSSVTVQDIALVQMQGSVIDTTLQYPGFTNASIATRVAQRDLRTLSTPIISATLYCDRTAADLNIGSVFKWTWPDLDINQLVMRVTGIAYGDGKRNQVRVTCTQDVYSLPLAPIVTPQPPLWVNPITPPVAVPDALRLPYEVPYLEMVQQNGQTTVDALTAANPALGYAGMAAGRPSQNSTFAHMNVDSGGGYVNQATIDFSPLATLTNPIGKMDTSFAISGVDSIDAAPIGSWFQIGTELMSMVSYSAPTLTVKRGLLDTAPEKHNAGDKLIFWDNFSANDATQYNNGQSLNIKVTPVTSAGELALASAPVDTLAIVGRLARPYPPGDFKINGSYFPANPTAPFSFTWVHRNRLTQTGAYLGFTDAGVTPEVGTTYNLRIYNNDTNALIYSNLGITGTSDTGVNVIDSADLRIELESQRAGLTSFQKITHIFGFVAFNYRITEASDRRITEDGNPRSIEGNTVTAVPSGVTRTAGLVKKVSNPTGLLVMSEYLSGNTVVRVVNSSTLVSAGSNTMTNADCYELVSNGSFTYGAFTTDTGGGKVIRIDHTNPTNPPTHTANFTNPITDAVVGNSSLWVADPYAAAVRRLSLADLSLTAVVSTGAVGLFYIASDGTYIYGVARVGANTIYKIDPATNAVVASISLGATLYIYDFKIVNGKFVVSIGGSGSAPKLQTRSLTTGAIINQLSLSRESQIDDGFGMITTSTDPARVLSDVNLAQQASIFSTSPYGIESMFVAGTNSVMLVSRLATSWSCELWNITA